MHGTKAVNRWDVNERTNVTNIFFGHTMCFDIPSLFSFHKDPECQASLSSIKL